MRNDCGGCAACCVVFSIDEGGLHKDAGERCQHMSRSLRRPGCRHYGERPEVCRRYRCGWLVEGGSRAQRPDKLGVVSGESNGRLGFFELRPGVVSREPSVLSAIAAKAHRPLVVYYRDGSVTEVDLPTLDKRGE
jgi:hypothetical protein